MSSNTPDPKFWDRANAIINLSNDQCDTSDPGEVGASTLYATARFTAFLLANSMGSAQNLQREKDGALDYFADQFRQMLAANIDDFVQNYDKFMGAPNP